MNMSPPRAGSPRSFRPSVIPIVLPSNRDSVSSNGSSHFMTNENLENVPITPFVAIPEKSHFSPATPAMERGFSGIGIQRTSSIRERVSKAFSWTSPAPHDECPCAHRKRGPASWFLLGSLVLALLFLFINVIVLDIDMGTRIRSIHSVQGPSQSTTELASAQIAPSPSASISPIPTPTQTSASPPAPSPSPVKLVDLPPDAAACMSQFPPPPTVDSKTYCSRCAQALTNVPQDWFTAQQAGSANGQMNLQTLTNAVQFCNAGPAGRAI